MNNKEKIEEAKKLYESANADQRYVLESLFPELKEREDERIRRDIISYIQVANQIIPQFQKDYWIAWIEKQGEQNKWKPSKDEMGALYGLAYITNEMDDKKDVAITKLYQDLKREFFNGASYENMFPSSPADSDINVEKQGGQKPAWGEEDDENIMMIEDRFSDYLAYIREDSSLTKHRKNTIKEEVIGYVNWLKQLKQRMGGQQ